MITFLFPVITREIPKDFLKNFKDFLEEVEVVFACHNSSMMEKLKKYKSVSVKIEVFPTSATEEDMIEGVVKKTYSNSLVLIRDGAGEINMDLIKNMILKEKQGYDVVLLKRNKTNKFKNFFSKLFGKIVGKIFGFKFYEGEIGYEVFGLKALNMLRINGSVNLTKLDRWIGFNVGYIDADIPKTKLVSKEKKNAILWTIGFCSGFLVALGGSITLGVLFNVPWIAILGMVVANLFTFSLGLFYLFKLYTIFKVGDLYSRKLDIIKTMELK